MMTSLIWIFLYVFSTLRIIEGDKCSDIPHSFMVAIFLHQNSKTQYLGGGTLLSTNWILTVGLHFYTDPRDIYYEAVAGADSLSEYFANETHLQKSRFAELHRTKEQIKRALDIALLKLQTPMKETKRVSFVRWSTMNDIGYKKLEDICGTVTIMGYFNSKSNDDEEENDDKEKGNLQCRQISVLSQIVCKKKLRDEFIPYESGCVFGADDACYGDAGGPVMCNDIQFGVLSYRYSCGEGRPSLFTRVYTYEKLIRSLLEEKFDHDIKPFFRNNFNTSWKNLLNNYLLNFILILYNLI